jgi:hypothetical protein
MQLFDAQFTSCRVALGRCATSTSVCPRRDLNQASRVHQSARCSSSTQGAIYLSRVQSHSVWCALCASVCSQRHGNNRLQKQKRLMRNERERLVIRGVSLTRFARAANATAHTRHNERERKRAVFALSPTYACAAAVKYRSVVSATLRLHLFWRYCTFNQL